MTPPIGAGIGVDPNVLAAMGFATQQATNSTIAGMLESGLTAQLGTATTAQKGISDRTSLAAQVQATTMQEYLGSLGQVTQMTAKGNEKVNQGNTTSAV